MSVDRMVRVNELMKREIAGALYRVMNEKNFDLSAVTITRVSVGSDLHHARVLGAGIGIGVALLGQLIVGGAVDVIEHGPGQPLLGEAAEIVDVVAIGQAHDLQG